MDLFTLALAGSIGGSGGEGGTSVVSTNVVEIQHNDQSGKDYPTQTAEQIRQHIISGEPSYLKIDNSFLPITILNTNNGYVAYSVIFNLDSSAFNDYSIYNWTSGELAIDSYSVHSV